MFNILKMPKCFKNIFNRENAGEKNIEDIFKKIYEISTIKELKIDTIVGKPIKVNNRTIYPIIEIFVIGDKMQSFKGVEIFPIALVIEEPSEKYVISLTKEEINSEEFIRMVSAEESKE